MKLILLIIAIVCFIVAVFVPFPHFLEIGLAFLSGSFLPLPN